MTRITSKLCSCHVTRVDLFLRVLGRTCPEAHWLTLVWRLGWCRPAVASRCRRCITILNRLFEGLPEMLRARRPGACRLATELRAWSADQ